MREATTNLIELIIGAILMGMGLVFLLSQYKALEELVDITMDSLIEDKDIYQQYSNLYFNQITEAELYTTIMGYREYPILIDGNLIPINQNDYELYFSYVNAGTYEKRYVYDSERNIIQIIYTYIGQRGST